MNLLSKFLLAVLFLTIASISWAACPEGTRNNYKGECVAIVSSDDSGQITTANRPFLSLNTKQAIEHYFRRRDLDPIEGIWKSTGHWRYEVAVIRNDFGTHPEFQYVGILTDSRNVKWHRGQVKFLIKSVKSLDKDFGVSWFMSDHTVWGLRFSRHKPNELSVFGLGYPFSLRRVYPEDRDARTQEPAVAGTTSDGPKLKLAGTGTAFVVNKHYLLTASHVVDDCAAVSIRHSHEELDVDVAAWDETNDLGLLKVAETFGHIAKFRSGKAIRLGDTVVNYGYPLFGQLSDYAKISKGEINSLAGWANDSRLIQYDAATQPGNSGGPVLDLSGNVVGIVSSGLSQKYTEATGHIAQNVNFAVKSYVAEGFLSANGVDFERSESAEDMKTADIAEKAERFTMLVGCWQ